MLNFSQMPDLRKKAESFPLSQALKIAIDSSEFSQVELWSHTQKQLGGMAHTTFNSRLNAQRGLRFSRDEDREFVRIVAEAIGKTWDDIAELARQIETPQAKNSIHMVKVLMDTLKNPNTTDAIKESAERVLLGMLDFTDEEINEICS